MVSVEAEYAPSTPAGSVTPMAASAASSSARGSACTVVETVNRRARSARRWYTGLRDAAATFRISVVTVEYPRRIASVSGAAAAAASPAAAVLEIALPSRVLDSGGVTVLGLLPPRGERRTSRPAL